MIDLTLTFWQAGERLTALKNAAQKWWQQVEQWVRFPLLQLDPETCTLTMLHVIAWQRDITRFSNEPEGLYRLRVKYAYANARDAGSVAGFRRILQRLGVGYVEIDERQPNRDWDIISVRLTDSQLSSNAKLLEVIIQQYGRTCRRYEWAFITPITQPILITEFGWQQTNSVAVLDNSAVLSSRLTTLNMNYEVSVATL